MLKCNQCGTENPDVAKYCCVCAMPIQQTITEPPRESIIDLDSVQTNIADSSTNRSYEKPETNLVKTTRFIVFTVGILFFFICVVYAFTTYQNATSASSWYERGTTASNNKDYKAAITAYSSAIEINPRYAEAYNNRGFAYKKNGQLDLAIADYNHAIALNPQLVMAYINRGAIYQDRGQFDQAITDFTKVIALDPRIVGAYSSRGIAYYKKGQYDQAITDFDQAIALDPRLALAYASRGAAFNSKGELYLARKKCIEWQPKIA